MRLKVGVCMSSEASAVDAAQHALAGAAAKKPSSRNDVNLQVIPRTSTECQVLYQGPRKHGLRPELELSRTDAIARSIGMGHGVSVALRR